MYELKTNTAARIVVGPAVDPDDLLAKLSLDVTDISVQICRIAQDGSAVVMSAFTPTASGGDNDMVHVASDTAGMYDLELTAAQLNFLGPARITFYDETGFLIHWVDILVLSAAYYDFKYGTTLPNVNVVQAGGADWANETRLNRLDATISSRSTLTAAQVWANSTRTLSSFGTLVSDIWSNATRTLTAISDSAGVTTLLSRISAALTFTGGNVNAHVKAKDNLDFGAAEKASLDAATPAVTVSDKTGFSLTPAYDAAKTAATQASVNAIPTNPVLTNDARLNNLDATISSRLADYEYIAPANADIAAVKAKTDNLPASPAAVGSEMVLTSAYDAAKTAASQSSVDTIDDNVDDIKLKTDALTFGKAEQVDVNVRSINYETITGTGRVGDEFGVD